MKIRTQFLIYLLIVLMFIYMIHRLKKLNEFSNNVILNQKSFYSSCHNNGLTFNCFFGRIFCFPGFTGQYCNQKLKIANPWYTDDCPNLNLDITYNETMSLDLISSGKNCHNDRKIKEISKCAYLCFSHEETGVAQIPISLWQLVQNNEFNIWKYSTGNNDRGKEHVKGFGHYLSLPKNLGNFIEIGCGPFTQTQFLINREFESITLLDPGARKYISHTPGCTYKNGYLKGKKVNVLSFGAEKLENENFKEKFDSALAINVVEHVWDAFKFYNNIYNLLKPGGILIYHDRYYPFPADGDKVLGPGNNFHPIRLTRVVFEKFFEQFETLYNFEGTTAEQLKRNFGEKGFYFIGRKKF